MIGSRQWRALVRRNMIYRKRNWIGSLLEILLPVIFVGFLFWIKSAVENSDGFEPEEVDATFPDDRAPYVSFSYTDYVTTLQAERKCTKNPEFDLPPELAELEQLFDSDSFSITGIPASGDNWQVPFIKCDSRLCREEGQDAQQFCEYLSLGVAPSSKSDSVGASQVDSFRQYIESRYPVLLDTEAMPFDFDFVSVFESESEIEEYVTTEAYSKRAERGKLALAVIFDGTDDSIDYNFKIRVNSTGFNSPEEEGRPAITTTPQTDRQLESLAREDSESCPILIGGTAVTGRDFSSCTANYIYNGFLSTQRLVNDFIFEDTGVKDDGYFVAEHGVQYVPFPSFAYVQNGFYAQIAGFAPLLITLGLLYPVAAMVRYIVLEKELRQKELMKMMSVSESDIGWSWWLTFFIFHAVTALASAGISSQLYEKSSFVILLIFWEFTFLSVISFSMFVASLFSLATRATLVSLLVFFCGYFLTLVAELETASSGTISMVSLHPVGAFAYGLQEIGRLEDKGVGLRSDTINSTDNPSGYTFVNTLGNFLFDAIFWGVLSWYVNRVAKADYGVPLPWYFPFTLSYWCPGSSKAQHVQEDGEIKYADGVPVEEVGNNLKEQTSSGKGIEIRNLKKVFGEKIAVDGLSMSLYNGQITALLGHNGAGKTTTISMLTGMLDPTEGYAKIGGKDIRTDMNAIRGEIGICLQHDCLFPNLTVKEHVQFFARIKGMYATMSYKEAEEKIEMSIQDVALSEKRNTFSKNLSGGMKRKLSVAIAFCGGSKTVLLDEPTSGMDPFSRRFTWNVIRQYRQDRCIILTTHFMDEADILGDRIAIMAEGQLRCLGSSLYLKKTYGVGYQLTIEKKSGNAEKVQETDIDNELESLVTESVTDATLLTNVGTEISFQLPLVSSNKFSAMFDELDERVADKQIVTYGVGITTLDEVFLLVARGNTSENKEFTSSRQQNEQVTLTEDDADKSARSRMNLEDEGLFTRHVLALFKKRALNFKRDKKAWCCTTILPSLFVLTGFLIFSLASPTRNLDELVLDIESLNTGITSSPRNPVTFNSGSQFSCQPGTCVYDFPVIISPQTGEFYGFCGIQSLADEETSCSIDEFAEIVDRIDLDGVELVPSEATNLLEASTILAESASDFDAVQYGAIYMTHDTTSIVNDNSSYTEDVVQNCRNNRGAYLSETECELYGGLGYVVQYNFTAVHGAPLFQMLADEAIIRAAKDDNDFKIKTVIHPLPVTALENKLVDASDAFSAWFLIILSFPFIAGSFGTFVVAERQSKAKHLQTVAGVKPVSYWLSTWLWDIANYQIPMWITVALMFIFSVDVMTTSEQGVFGGILSLLVLFGPASAAYTYCISFIFTSPSICNLFMIITGFFVAMGGTLAAFILRLLGDNPFNPRQNLVNAANIVEWVLRFSPPFCLGKGIFNAINLETFEFLEAKTLTVWHERVLLYEVIFLGVESIAYLLLAMLIDRLSNNPNAVSAWRSFVSVVTLQFLCSSTRRFEDLSTVPDDDDVVAEKDRVMRGDANDDLIVVSGISKEYSNGKKAVDNLSFGIPPGQCFGLLGINGAGKTTTMGMLTAEFPPSSGDATLAGFSVKSEPEKTRRRVGYCPQFDAHFTNMTGREHVELYASIKGIPLAMVQEAAASKLAEVGLSEFDSDRLSSGYSGGMKRRLSLACATIGQPQLVFLDECSTGVDPVARREIWQMISDMVSNKNVPPEERTSVILTTHSMEECEALCPMIGIMAGGKMRCLGSAQHLKSKFGQGYQVEMKVQTVNTTDEDYQSNLVSIAQVAGVSLPTHQTEEEAESGKELGGVFVRLEQAWAALASLSGDEYLTSMLNAEDPSGYIVFKEASSPTGIDLDGLTEFATRELRMRKMNDFIMETYPESVLRERQDTKARYEVNSEGIKIGNVFSSIEENKEKLKVAEYGVSQTSLEQVFNIHAAEAEKAKYGTNDG